MIIDRIENAARYAGLGPRYARALQLLATGAFTPAAPGRHEIDGEDLYCMVQEYASKPESAGRVEAHRRYADIQAVLEGSERIGYCDLGSLQPVESNPGTDMYFYSSRVDFVTVAAGFFMLLLPGEGHMPCIQAGEAPMPVRKLVFKVRGRPGA